MRVVTVPCKSVNGTTAYVVDRDCQLLSVAHAGGTVAVSLDPLLTVAALAAAPVASASITGDIFAFLSSSSATQFLFGNVKIPLSKGTTIYLANAAATFVFLALEDVISAENLVT
jgi:hypothetical protein